MGRAMFSPDVVGTDLFFDQSDDAQLTYYRLGSEGTYGKIVGVKRIVRGYGGSMSALDELYQNGYLFDYGGACWVRHFWVNNVFKHPNNAYALTMPEIARGQLVTKGKGKDEPTVREYGSASGGIAFEGEPFKSAFVLKDFDKPYPSLDEGSTDSVTDPDPVAGAWSDPGEDPLAGSETCAGEGACGEGEPPRRCPKCEAPLCAVEQSGKVHVECMQCGYEVFIDKATGECVESIA